MILDELAAFLQTQGQGMEGTTLFAGYMEDLPDVCIALYEYLGMPPEMTHDVIGIAYETPRLQVVCRGIPDDYLGPRTTAQTIFLLLQAIQNTMIGGVYYRSIVPLGSPFLRDRDPKARVHIACNYQCIKRPLAG